MRALCLTLLIVVGLAAVPAMQHSSALSPFSPVATLHAQDPQQPPPAQQPPQVTVQVHRDGHAWYASPVWVAIGVIAAVLIVMLIVMAARGGSGGATVVKG
jgi:hypothetical protein